MFDDFTDSSIASDFGISTHTVHTHFERLHQKLGVPNRAKLILRVVNEFLTLTATTPWLSPAQPTAQQPTVAEATTCLNGVCWCRL